MKRGTKAELVGKRVSGRVAGSPEGLTARGLSQQQTGRVGPVSTYFGRWCRNVPPAQGLGSAHCILVLADAAASALAQEVVDAWSFVWWLQPGAFRGSQNLDTGPWVHKARPESLPGVDFWPEASPGTLTQPAATPHWTSSSLSVQ